MGKNHLLFDKLCKTGMLHFVKILPRKYCGSDFRFSEITDQSCGIHRSVIKGIVN